jgi:cardiolipin synthase (CMP-forming)
LSLPNIITVARLLMVPLIVWLIVSGYTQAAFAAFVAAGVSDAADGYIAKRYHMETELGAYLDPLADKSLIVCVCITLGINGALPLWLVIAIVSRDILIVTAVVLSWVMDNPVKIRPHIVSKANTVAQIVLVATVLADEGLKLGLGDLRTFLIAIAAVLTAGSLASYLRSWFRHMSEPMRSV